MPPHGKVTFEVTGSQCQKQKENFFASVIISHFRIPHPNSGIAFNKSPLALALPDVSAPRQK